MTATRTGRAGAGWMRRSLILGLALSCATGVGCGGSEPGAALPDSRTSSHAEHGSDVVSSTASNFGAPAALVSNLEEAINALNTGAFSAESLTQNYLARIEAMDRQGPRLRSVIAINPEALEQARASDNRRRAGATLGPLDGIPVLIKDNIETVDPMPTTAGSTALLENFAVADSPLVSGLRSQGAVVLGKSNLSQWANFRSTSSISGWSAVGGQVRNPHILDRSPCGSSSGSGVAVAAGLTLLAVGTETNGSITCPASVNGIVGFKPTLGVIPQAGIIPIAASQDTAGPMTVTVAGAAAMMDAMAVDGGDYVASLSDASLDGVTLGVMRFSQGSNPLIVAAFEAALDQLAAAGATLVEVDSFSNSDEDFWDHELVVLETEFRSQLDAYLAGTPATVETRSMASLIAFNEAAAEVELPLFGQEHFESSLERGEPGNPDYQRARNAVLEAAGSQGIDALLAEAGASALVAPSGPLAPAIDLINGDTWPEWAGIGHLAAVAGYPHLTVPIGLARKLPVGLSFIAGANADRELLRLGHAWQQRFGQSPKPGFLATAADASTLQSAVAGTLEGAAAVSNTGAHDQ